jgi:hypothetical protein
MYPYNKTLKEELLSRKYRLDYYLNELEEKEYCFKKIAKRLKHQETLLESNYIDSSRTMFIAECYTQYWPELLQYHNEGVVKRLFYSGSVKDAYKCVTKRLHCEGLPDISEDLKEYLTTYKKLREMKQHKERAFYCYNLMLECYSDLLDNLPPTYTT